MIYQKEYLNNNVTTSKNFLEGIIKYNIKNLIFSSSASLFGSINAVKVDESNPKFPMNFYGGSKLIFEEILIEKVREFNLSAAILRYFNAAGADDSGLIGEYHKYETHLIPSIFNNLIGKKNSLKIY